MTAFPALGFDPAPGDPGELARLGRDTARAAGEVQELAQVLRALSALGADWCGLSATAFAEQVGDLPRQLGRAHDAFGEVARQVGHWSDSLEALQAEARAAERDAAEALARLRAARAHASSLGLPPTGAGAGALVDHLADGQAAARAVDAAEAALAAARAQGERVRERARDGTQRVERAVREAAQVAPPEPGFFARVSDSLIAGVERLNEGARTFVEKHKEAIAAVVDAVSVVAFAAGFVPGVGWAVLLGAGVAVLLGTSLLAACTDEKDMGDVGMAAVGVALGGGARVAEKAAMAARATATGAPVRALPSMFTNGLTMGQDELLWRTVQLQPVLAGHAVGVVDTTRTLRDRGVLPPAGTSLAARRPAQVHVRSVEPGRAAAPEGP